MSGRSTLNVGDVVLAAFKVCGDRWKELLKVTAKTILPAAVFGSLLVATYMPDVLLDAFGKTLTPEEADAALKAVPTSDWVNLGIAGLIYILISSIANVIAFNGCIHIALAHHAGEPLDDATALRTAFRKVGSMFWLLLMSGLGILAGFLLCILPGVWLFAVWSVAPIVLIKEGLKGTKALGRSRQLVKATFWPVLAVLALEFVTLFVLQAITGALPGLFLPGAAGTNSFAIFFTLSLGSAIAGLFGVALHAAIATELYFGLTPAIETPPQAAVVPPPPPVP